MEALADSALTCIETSEDAQLVGDLREDLLKSAIARKPDKGPVN
jgi:hypothetical protein